MKIVSKKKVNKKKIYLAKSEKVGWFIRMEGLKEPIAMFFDDEKGAERLYKRIGQKNRGGIFTNRNTVIHKRAHIIAKELIDSNDIISTMARIKRIASKVKL